jgi:RHH-type proline utilization regulon transcriptional repressor/proline dehydrogenase/delta 1-pyrroline-5-carboxylate dehydrogenase
MIETLAASPAASQAEMQTPSPADPLPTPLAPPFASGDEQHIVAQLLQRLEPYRALLEGSDAEGAALAQAMRGAAQSSLALRLMSAFPLSSPAGLSLMRMTEALLRIPDAATAAQLVSDELASSAWQPENRDRLARLAGLGLRTGRGALRGDEGRPRAAFAALALALGRRFVRHFGGQFVFAQTIGEAVRDLRAGGAYSFDMLGEQALDAADVARYDAAYAGAIAVLGPLRQAGRDVSVSIKLSALHARYQPQQLRGLRDELLPRVGRLVQAARGFDLPVYIDAEEAARLELSLDLFDALSRQVAGWSGLGLAVQAYQPRALAVLARVVDIARRDGRRVPLRLVKGAYWDGEIKRAQAEGLAQYPVFTRKAHTDLNYLACALAMFEARDALAPAFATHNAYSFAAVRALAAHFGAGGDYEYQCLHGMGEPLYDAARRSGRLEVPVRVYAPVGAFDALLPYLVRRLLENGANSSFLAQLGDGAPAAADHRALFAAGARGGALPLPQALYPGRRNASGIDFGSTAATRALLQAAAPDVPALVAFYANQAVAPMKHGDSAMLSVANPATGAALAALPLPDAAALDAVCARARGAQPRWQALAAAGRAARIEAWGDALEAALPRLAALAVHEAGKTWPNAVADVREAVDFCRYYALLARQQGEVAAPPLGTVLAISPWNFPLAIFTGQVAAALAAGNTVVAKPAEQTPLMALAAWQLAQQAGIDAEVLQVVPGGAEQGAALVDDARIDGVLFTGSLAVAKRIEARLHARSRGREIPLVAETSGLNAMVVDSSALVDQAVTDVLASAFDSAGQRCSALRLLWLQDDIAPRFLQALAGALACWRVGDPARLDTDVGPLIDAEALGRLRAHAARLERDGARLVARAPLAAEAQAGGGFFFAPAAYEVDTLDALREETFGPLLHIRRYAAGELDRVLADTAALGYALTGGVHSRIKSRIDQVTRDISAGNVYVNRNIIGAVVGAQPFGGGRKSGTGPKAGGPWALHRLRRAAPRRHEQGELFAWRKPQPLPSITGEHNSWQIAPRGVVACCGPDADALRQQRTLCARLGLDAVDAAEPAELAAALARPDLGALLRAAWDADWALAAARLRADIPPLVVPDEAGEAPAMSAGGTDALAAADNDPCYPAWRLFEERVVSDNIAAAGGNAELLVQAAG